MNYAIRSAGSPRAPGEQRGVSARSCLLGLRPGGLLLNGDHLSEDERAAPTLARLCQALIQREDQRRAPGG